MNYAEARQRADGSGWAFTVRNDDDIWTAECCRGEDGPHVHATEEEAVACFNEWRRMDERFSLDGGFADWQGCAVCDAPTKTAAIHRDLGGRDYIALCADHLTVEHARSQVHDSGRVIYS